MRLPPLSTFFSSKILVVCIRVSYDMDTGLEQCPDATAEITAGMTFETNSIQPW